jgi:hypothetical protein
MAGCIARPVGTRRIRSGNQVAHPGGRGARGLARLSVSTGYRGTEGAERTITVWRGTGMTGDIGLARRTRARSLALRAARSISSANPHIAAPDPRQQVVVPLKNPKVMAGEPAGKTIPFICGRRTLHQRVQRHDIYRDVLMFSRGLEVATRSTVRSHSTTWCKAQSRDRGWRELLHGANARPGRGTQ